MILDRISGPADLRRLDDADLRTLAQEIRSLIVETVSANGGHLGSNLGAVELTLALHRVFESPEDVILWDTGHQAYVHKIVTGRHKQFDRLRQTDGLSGYPSRSESPHDWVENSHASTILSYAHGMAVARDSEGRDNRIVAVIGDGSLTGGMAYEGLNNLGVSGRDVIIVLNDNGRSYAPTVSRLGESLSRLRLDPRFRRSQARLEQRMRQLPVVGELAGMGIEGAKAAVRQVFEPPAFFETLGVQYIGPLDGHDVRGLERAFANAAKMGGPVVVHVLTQKGRGHAPAENDPIKAMHDTSESKPGSYTAAFTEALLAEGEDRSDLIAITAAMPDSTGLLPFAHRFPERFLDVGIAEQHAVTAAAGMAMGGLRPVVAVYSTFLSRAFDQVNLDVGLHGLPVVFCLDRAGITGDDGPSHHGVLDMVLMTKVPNMTVYAPSSYQELSVMLHDALDDTAGPSCLRWSKTMPPQVPFDEVGEGRSARLVRSGTDVCIIGVGKMLTAAREAADLLEATGVSATVWDPRVVKPLDPAMVEHAAGHRLVVTIEDGYASGGVGEAIAAEIRASGSAAMVRVLGVPMQYIPHGRPDEILAGFGLDGTGVAAEVGRGLRALSEAPEQS